MSFVLKELGSLVSESYDEFYKELILYSCNLQTRYLIYDFQGAQTGP